MLEEKIKNESFLGNVRKAAAKSLGNYCTALALGTGAAYGTLLHGCEEDDGPDYCTDDSDCKNGYVCSNECHVGSCPEPSDNDPCATGLKCADESGQDHKNDYGKTSLAASCTVTKCDDICVKEDSK